MSLLLTAAAFAALAAGGVAGQDAPLRPAVQIIAEPPLTAASPSAALVSASPLLVLIHKTVPPRAAAPRAPDVFAVAPEMTGSLQQRPGEAYVFTPSLLAAVAPDPTQDPFSLASPGTTPASPAAAPTPAGGEQGPTGTPASVAPGSTPPRLADRLHAALDALMAREVSGRAAGESRKINAAIMAFYLARDFAPLWVANGKPNAAAQAVEQRLARAEDDGFSLADLPEPVFSAGDDEKLAAAELALTQRVVAYARRASGSRVDPHQIAALIGVKPAVVEPGDILATVAAAGEHAGAVLADFNPPQPGYRSLRDKLAEVRRATKPVAGQPIPAGPPLKVGMSDPRVPLIRARFGIDSDLPDRGVLYDTKVAAAIAEFQKASGLPPSGVLTARTIAALSVSHAAAPQLESQLIANMEMWRWMPREVSADRIEVNVPNFEVTVFRDGAPTWRSKVIVGKPQTPTPLFSNVMRFLIVNPYWNVPPSIIRKEMLPRLAQDPSYLARMGYEAFTRNGRLVVRQPPGERNALGRIKFMFPNDYSVYLHDTPSRALFGQAKRAFSHGCVRVDEPFNFAQAVLGDDWPIARIKHLIGGAERYVNLPEPLPINIEYFTAFVDADGHLQLRDDVYGYIGKMVAALGLEK